MSSTIAYASFGNRPKQQTNFNVISISHKSASFCIIVTTELEITICLYNYEYKL